MSGLTPDLSQSAESRSGPLNPAELLNPVELPMELRSPDWTGMEEEGELLTQFFVQNKEWEWLSVYFPFVWSCGENKGDGYGGPPVSNPLELHLVLTDTQEDAAAIRKFDLRQMILDDAECVGAWGDGKPNGEAREWAAAMVAALETLAAEIRTLARVTQETIGDA